MKLTYLPLRMEFLSVGEELGWPRLAFGRGRVLPSGQGNWEGFARGPIQMVMPALRNAKVRRDNLSGEKESEEARLMLYKDRLRFGEPEVTPQMPIEEEPELTVRQRRVAGLAKARAARSAKIAARKAVV